MNFISPRESESDATIRLTENDGITKVQWSIRGEFGAVERLVMMFMDLDGKIGPEFEAGLADLKTKVEQENNIISSKDKMPANAN